MRIDPQTGEEMFPVLFDPYGRDKMKTVLDAGVRMMPIQVPFKMLEPHERQAQKNHSQTLRGLAGRGGLAWSEMAAVLQDREWSKMPDREAIKIIVLALVAYGRPET
jgi:hypothetical protein